MKEFFDQELLGTLEQTCTPDEQTIEDRLLSVEDSVHEIQLYALGIVALGSLDTYHAFEEKRGIAFGFLITC